MKFLFALLLLPALAFGQAFTMNDIPFMAQQGTDWERRVVANGGARPSAVSINCMETLRTTLIAQGITNKIYSLCVFVPDSVIAASTPLFKHKGADPWTNFNFVIGDLNINGLKGDGTSKALDTGVKAKLGEATQTGEQTKGLTYIITETATNRLQVDVGQQDADGDPLFVLTSSLAISQFLPGANTALQRLGTNDSRRVGFFSGSCETNGSTTNITLYVASPTESFKALSTRTTFLTASSTTTTEDTIPYFANKIAGTNTQWSANRISAAVVHNGLSESQTSNLWVALKACRECLGGGTGDQIHDYATRVTTYGGSAISVGTSNALRDFRIGLDTDGLLYNMVVVNCYVPDNLVAVRLPLIYQNGFELWTNNAFAASNLTVNGLTGDGTTKFLGTAINPTTVVQGGFSDTSAGMTILNFLAPTSSGDHEFAVNGTAANSLFSLLNESGVLKFYCWKFVTVNTEFVAITAPSPGATWPGYLSGNRTAANAIRLDWVTNSVWNIATNGTGNQTGARTSMTNLYAHAISGPGTVAASWSDRTISFIALHPGLTTTQSSNLWIRVFNLRTAFGGGLP